MGRIIFDYVWITLAIAIVFALIGYFFPDLGSSSSSVVTTMIAAMVAGQLHGQRTGLEVSSGFAWKAAAILTLVSLAIGVAFIALVQMSGEPLLPEDASFGVFGVILAIFVFIGFLITRFAFRWGVKTGAKAAALKQKTKPEIFD